MALADAPAGEHLDGIELIKKDHRDVQELFRQYRENSTGSNPEAKIKLAREICTTVAKHASAEERYVYPLITKLVPQDKAPKYLYDMMVMDDTVNKDILEYLDSHTPRTEQEWAVFDKVFNKFLMIETEHFAKEESMVLDVMADVLTREEKEKIAHNFLQGLKDAPLHPHPNGPTAGIPSKILHPVAGAADRAGQALTGLMHKMWPGSTDKAREAAIQGTEAGYQHKPSTGGPPAGTIPAP